MKRIFSAKPLVAASVAIGALAAASTVHAGEVSLSIGVHAPYGYGYTQPAPVYVHPQPVYVHPQPAYVYPGTVYHHDHDRWHRRRGPWGDADRDGVPNIYDRDSRFHHGYGGYYRHGGWRDADRDGVPNRYDRAPTNPYYR